LAFRSWTLDRARLTLGSTTPAGGFQKKSARDAWMAGALAAPLGAWPKHDSLEANCNARNTYEDDEAFEEAHFAGNDGRVAIPGPECKGTRGHGCGIYATTDLSIINTYLSRTAPILGIVEMGGRVLDCAQGYRAEFASVAAILLIDEVLTKPIGHSLLEKVANIYGVPAIVPFSTVAEDYRSAIHPEETVVTDSEIAMFLKGEL
jgi:hypothetical protein